MKKLLLFIFAVLGFVIAFTTSCGKEGEPTGELADLEYTIASERDLPDNLRTIIEQRKEHPFQLTYSTTDSLYIVKGYGAQKTGGYSIQVRSLCKDNSAIYFDPVLVGPSEQDQVANTPSFPYIVIKTELSELPVEFPQ